MESPIYIDIFILKQRTTSLISPCEPTHITLGNFFFYFSINVSFLLKVKGCKSSSPPRGAPWLTLNELAQTGRHLIGRSPGLIEKEHKMPYPIHGHFRDHMRKNLQQIINFYNDSFVCML